MDNKPYKDYICPRCKHNVNYMQQYCGLCGLDLNWNEVGITYISKPFPIIPTDNNITGIPSKGQPPAIITC